jgi:hypothetical protein
MSENEHKEVQNLANLVMKTSKDETNEAGRPKLDSIKSQLESKVLEIIKREENRDKFNLAEAKVLLNKKIDKAQTYWFGDMQKWHNAFDRAIYGK